jgi:hypothetical protein
MPVASEKRTVTGVDGWFRCAGEGRCVGGGREGAGEESALGVGRTESRVQAEKSVELPNDVVALGY